MQHYLLVWHRPTSRGNKSPGAEESEASEIHKKSWRPHLSVFVTITKAYIMDKHQIHANAANVVCSTYVVLSDGQELWFRVLLNLRTYIVHSSRKLWHFSSWEMCFLLNETEVRYPQAFYFYRPSSEVFIKNKGQVFANCVRLKIVLVAVISRVRCRFTLSFTLIELKMKLFAVSMRHRYWLRKLLVKSLRKARDCDLCLLFAINRIS